MALDTDDLREVDQLLLDYLRERAVTAAYARKRMMADGDRNSITGTYLGQRLQRFEEHGHVENLYDTGLYELRADIPDTGGDE